MKRKVGFACFGVDRYLGLLGKTKKLTPNDFHAVFST
jgi:hypothetical protein